MQISCCLSEYDCFDETLGKSFVSPMRSSPAMGVGIGDLGMVAERVEGGAESVEGGAEGGDFVYDYYWMDPDSAHAAVLADGKVCVLSLMCALANAFSPESGLS